MLMILMIQKYTSPANTGSRSLSVTFVVKFQTCYLLIREGEFKCDQRSRPIKDLEPMIVLSIS